MLLLHRCLHWFGESLPIGAEGQKRAPRSRQRRLRALLCVAASPAVCGCRLAEQRPRRLTPSPGCGALCNACVLRRIRDEGWKLDVAAGQSGDENAPRRPQPKIARAAKSTQSPIPPSRPLSPPLALSLTTRPAQPLTNCILTVHVDPRPPRLAAPRRARALPHARLLHRLGRVLALRVLDLREAHVRDDRRRGVLLAAEELDLCASFVSLAACWVLVWCRCCRVVCREEPPRSIPKLPPLPRAAAAPSLARSLHAQTHNPNRHCQRRTHVGARDRVEQRRRAAGGGVLEVGLVERLGGCTSCVYICAWPCVRVMMSASCALCACCGGAVCGAKSVHPAGLSAAAAGARTEDQFTSPPRSGPSLTPRRTRPTTRWPSASGSKHETSGEHDSAYAS